ncbi:hypothetical protein N9N13_08960 [Opitutales bacterium]|jgi:hypothetical protein|nr:hypothetical protein [Opitutales bacterium]
MNPFSELLNSLIQDHPDNLSTIARNAHLSRPSLYDLINGKTLPRPKTFDNLLKAISLTENSTNKLSNYLHLERIKTSRKEQENYRQEKKHLLNDVSSLLLGRGYEISRPKIPDYADLILRQNSNRIPIIICPSILDHASTLGILLKSMFQFSSSKGFVCTHKITIKDRPELPLFLKYGTKITTIKTILRELG